MLITTTKNVYIIKALESVFFAAFSDVCVISVDEFSFLESEAGTHLLRNR